MAYRRLLQNSLSITSNLLKNNVKISNNYGESLNFRIVSTAAPLLNKKQIEVTFVKANGERIKTKANIGDSLLDVVVNNSIDLDGFGACEGTLTCSTCHLIFSKDDFNTLPNKPSEEELDMLDLAYELTDTSRLGCQIILDEKMDGLLVKVPSTINDVRS